MNYEDGFSLVTIDIPTKADMDEKPFITISHNPQHLHISFILEDPPSVVYPKPEILYKDFDERVFSQWEFVDFLELNEKFDIMGQI